MVVMMFMKWIMYSAVTHEMGNGKCWCSRNGILPSTVLSLAEVKFGSSCAPLILIYFIDMMLFKQPDEVKNCEKFMFEGQEVLQYVLVFGALACIPVMLFAKPIFIQCTRRSKPHVNFKKMSFL
jgi:hypothetical protein